MKAIVLASLFLFGWWADAQGQGVKFFEGSFAQAKQEAARQHRYLYVDCYTVWCGPCREMNTKVFPVPEVADYMNSHFVCYKQDMQKDDGPAIGKQYHVEAYPTHLFLDSLGNLIHYSVGGGAPAPFLKAAKTAMNDSENYRGMVGRYEKGERDSAFLKKLIRTLESTNSNHDDPVNLMREKALASYWALLPDSAFLEKENFQMFQYFETDIRSRPYKYLFTKQKIFIQKFFSHFDYSQYGPMAHVAVEDDSDLMYSKAAIAVKTAADTKDSALFLLARGIAMQSKYDEARYTTCAYEIQYLNNTGQWGIFYKDADAYLSVYGAKRHSLYNYLASEIEENTDSAAMLLKGLEYIQTCMGYGKSADNVDTYARLLYKLHRYNDALAAAKESIGLAKPGDDTEGTAKLLADIQKAKGAAGK